MRFDAADLRLFLNIALAGSITAGARRSHLALASASARLRAMEDSLGTPLLERRRRGIEPTAAGRVLLGHARQIVQQMEEMRQDLDAYAQGRRGRIRLMCNTVTLVEFLPQVLGPFLAANPLVDVDIEEQPSRHIITAVGDGLADLGIAAYATESARLATFAFRRDRLVVVCATDHPLSGRDRVDFAEVIEHDFIGLGLDSAIQDLLSSHATLAGRRLKFRVHLRGFAGICEMASLGVGVAIVPDSAARRAGQILPLARMQLADPWATRDLMICVRRQKPLPPLVQGLLDALRYAEQGDG